MTEPQLAAVDERPKKTATETSQETKGEHDQHDKTPPAEVLGKAKRGRPRKKLPEVRIDGPYFFHVYLSDAANAWEVSESPAQGVDHEVIRSELNLDRVNIDW